MKVKLFSVLLGVVEVHKNVSVNTLSKSDGGKTILYSNINASLLVSGGEVKRDESLRDSLGRSNGVSKLDIRVEHL